MAKALTRHATSEKLFGFYKAFHQRKDSKGIGLFLTKTQVEAMGGSIQAESELGKGTVFTLVLGVLK
jgi:signal transduction histidine kinase